MALPVKKASDLAADMAKKGLISSISMGEPHDSEDPESEDPTAESDQGVEATMKDIDALVPGLGKLVQELCERLTADPASETDDQ